LNIDKEGIAMQYKKTFMVMVLLAALGHAAGSAAETKTRKEYSADGKLQATYSCNDRGVLDGAVKYYYPNGAIFMEETYRNNMQVGAWKLYGPNGRLRFAGTCAEPGTDGMVTIFVYNDDGGLQRQESWKNSRLCGIYREYYRSGALQSEGSYQDGRREGVFRKYYESGKINSEKTFRTGRAVSETCYDEQGGRMKCPRATQ
jgi:antitoxin component YwqK of YwqJK toxin-antitoxin module